MTSCRCRRLVYESEGLWYAPRDVERGNSHSGPHRVSATAVQELCHEALK